MRDTQTNMMILDRLAYTPINAELESLQTKNRSVLAKLTDKDMRVRPLDGREPMSSEGGPPVSSRMGPEIYDFVIPEQPRSQQKSRRAKRFKTPLPQAVFPGDPGGLRSPYSDRKAFLSFFDVRNDLALQPKEKLHIMATRKL